MPNDNPYGESCPVEACQLPANGSCRCINGHLTCANGHEWKRGQGIIPKPLQMFIEEGSQ